MDGLKKILCVDASSSLMGYFTSEDRDSGFIYSHAKNMVKALNKMSQRNRDGNYEYSGVVLLNSLIPFQSNLEPVYEGGLTVLKFAEQIQMPSIYFQNGEPRKIAKEAKNLASVHLKRYPHISEAEFVENARRIFK